jgi:hypothetical protein
MRRAAIRKTIALFAVIAQINAILPETVLFVPTVARP